MMTCTDHIALISLWASFALESAMTPHTSREVLDRIEAALAGELNAPASVVSDLSALDWQRSCQSVGKP